jgi:SAM-dependent methyltransferase
MTSLSTKPFSQACANNSEPILRRIQPLLKNSSSVFEIGSGTGQHSVYFGAAMPQLYWHTSDLSENFPAIQQWLSGAQLSNVRLPVVFDVDDPPLIERHYDAVFMANTLHIMSWHLAVSAIRCSARLLKKGGFLLVYGPFKYAGSHTSDSNAQFDQWLKATDSARGIRDFEQVAAQAATENFELMKDDAMPANNRLLIWRRVGACR